MEDKNFWPWLAGFFEGDGSCGCYTSDKGRHKLQASLSQKLPHVLRYVKSVIGGGSVVVNRYSYGKVFHWRIDSATARKFLNNIRPFMRVPHKMGQVDRALSKDKKYVGPITGRMIKRSKNGAF